MKILKYLLLLVLVIIVGLVIYAALQPSAYEVTRTRTVKAPVEVVYNNVEDYKNWEAWGPWKEEDPSMTYTYSDQTKGLGASYSWSGKDGDGSATTIEAVQNAALTNELDFDGMGTANGFWEFAPVAEGTEVTWGIRAEETPFIFKFFGAISGGYDAMMGPMFERGLERLDSVAQIEAKAYTDAMNSSRIGEVSQKSMKAQKFIGFAHSIKIDDHEGMKAIFEESMPKAGSYVAENGLQVGEDYVPGAIYTRWDEEKGETDFMVGVFLNKDLPTAEGMQQMNLPKGEVVTISKFGNYGIGNEEAHMVINKHIQENKLTINGPIYEMYVNDPTVVKPNEIQTDIYYSVSQ
ncbi:MAG: SRPBCC family protein [Saonia sp.]